METETDTLIQSNSQMKDQISKKTSDQGNKSLGA